VMLRESGALIIRGLLQRSPENVVSIVADGAERLALGIPDTARNFR
jgi:error-prone DNA polymerase